MRRMQILRMRILLIGASGFIGRHLMGGLLAAGHQVIGAARNPLELSRRFPGVETLACDFSHDLSPEVWLPRLQGVDTVINAAGLLDGRELNAVHSAGPRALFIACEQAGVKRVIHISAISADEGAGTAYAASKLSGDDFLRASGLDWVILRPSLVYGEGSFGGTSLLRGLAALPGAVFLSGDGEQEFQPIHMDDLVETALRVLADKSISRLALDPMGPERLTTKDILLAWRGWLGIKPSPVINVPMFMIKMMGRVVDICGGGPLGTTAIRQLEYGNAGDPEPFIKAIGFTPKRMSEALIARPASVQHRWHARLYFLRPLIRIVLGLSWIISGLIGVLAPLELSAPFREMLGLPQGFERLIALLFCGFDVIFGGAVLKSWRPPLLAKLQLGLVLGYTIGLSLVMPGLWLDPFGALLKNFAFMALIGVWAAIEDEK
jgi:uncharacterized protein YbjT (DUF2867 family)